MLVYQDGETWREWRGECLPSGSWAPPNIETLPQTTTADLAGLGLYRATIVDSSPTRYHAESGRQYAIVGDGVEITRSWETPPLETIKASANARINMWKLQQQDGGFVLDGATYDSDPRSRANITGAVLKAVLAAQAGQPMSITWIDKDNTPHTFDGPQVIALGLAAAAHVEAMHVSALAKKADVNASTTAGEIAAIIDGIE